jgi:hypothetical protein
MSSYQVLNANQVLRLLRILITFSHHFLIQLKCLRQSFEFRESFSIERVGYRQDDLAFDQYLRIGQLMASGALIVESGLEEVILVESH